jgi:hypothetical protein
MLRVAVQCGLMGAGTPPIKCSCVISLASSACVIKHSMKPALFDILDAGEL